MDQIEAFPLNWPMGYERTPAHRRQPSRFSQTMEKAQHNLRLEIGRMGASGLIVSTNIRIRRDSYMYTEDMNKKLDDPGVAIHFKYEGKPVAMCCDTYYRVWENIYALSKGIESLRGMERWGVSEFLKRAFTGFAALPDPTAAKPWWEVLGVHREADMAVITSAFRNFARTYHPDVERTGDTEMFRTFREAYEQAKKERGE